MFSPIQHPRGLLTKYDILRFGEIAKYCEGDVLDVGCGERKLKESLNKECTYIGIDIDMTGESYGDVYDLPFSDNSFTTVVLSEVLEHLVYPLKALTELRRVSSNIVIVSIPNPYSINQLGYMLKYNTNCIDPDHIGMFGDNEMKNLCNLAGFSNIIPIRFYTYIPIINWLTPIKSSFGEWSIYKMLK